MSRFGVLGKLVSTIINSAGYQITSKEDRFEQLPIYLEADARSVIRRVQHQTMVSLVQIMFLIKVTEYLTKAGIPGDIVECGVWKGGAVKAILLKLMQLEDQSRTVWLYDTFEGMSDPTDKDVELDSGLSASALLGNPSVQSHYLCRAPLSEVKSNLRETLYPETKLRFIKGDVLLTLYEQLPNRIALLRLDTDWYESTKVEMEQLFPLVVEGGIIIVDDYGYWKGSKLAVDEYLQRCGREYLVSPIDKYAVFLVK